jgi:hypothetical protein
MGGVFLFFQGSESKDEKNYRNKICRWPPFDILHATTNQKHAGMTEGGWHRPHNRARTFGERDGNDKGDEDDEDEYGKDGKDGDIPDEPFDFFHATTNQKHAGVTEGGWYRPHNRSRTVAYDTPYVAYDTP